MTILDIQRALKAAGFDPGPRDGAWGALTRNAYRAWQMTRGYRFDGVPKPDELVALSGIVSGGPASKRIEPPWYAELGRRMGLHEVRDRSKLMAWLRSDGRTLGDPAKHPWCGDAIETPIARTVPDEPLPSNPYLARNWLKFGVPLAEPAIGAIGVFWRGSRTGISGHVALYKRQNAAAFEVRGGNQSDRISDVWIDQDRLLEWRWPKTLPLPTGGRVLVAATGTLSTNEA